MQIYAFYHYLHVFSFFMIQILTIINPPIFPIYDMPQQLGLYHAATLKHKKSNTLPAQRPLFSKHHSLEKVYGFDHYSLEKVFCFICYSLEKVCCFSYYSLEKVYL